MAADGCRADDVARIGMVSGNGLAAALKQKFPKWLIIVMAIALLVANTVNVAADLNGMADAANMLTGINSYIWVVIFGVGIAFATVQFRYRWIANVLKWLALTLFSYIITAFIVHPHWKGILRDTVLPSWPKNHDAWAALVAILCTTISPYLFFWQTSLEVEEQKAEGKRMLVIRHGATGKEIISRKWDVGTGAFFSNLVMYFIILTTALTLHPHGITKIETSQQAAEALKPFAGNFAASLFTFGIVGVGLLAIPTLAGSAAYAFADLFRWRQGLDAKFSAARYFYAVIFLSIGGGIVINLAHINPVSALFYSAVINGGLAPFLMTCILWTACDRKIMKNQPSSLIGRVTMGLATALMFAAAIGMFVT